MNFYFEASKVLDRLDARQGSVKSLLSTLPEKNRARMAALVIETLKCKPRCPVVYLDIEKSVCNRQGGSLRRDHSLQISHSRKEDHVAQLGTGPRS